MKYSVSITAMLLLVPCGAYAQNDPMGDYMRNMAEEQARCGHLQGTDRLACATGTVIGQGQRYNQQKQERWQREEEDRKAAAERSYYEKQRRDAETARQYELQRERQQELNYQRQQQAQQKSQLRQQAQFQQQQQQLTDQQMIRDRNRLQSEIDATKRNKNDMSPAEYERQTEALKQKRDDYYNRVNQYERDRLQRQQEVEDLKQQMQQSSSGSWRDKCNAPGSKVSC